MTARDIMTSQVMTLPPTTAVGVVAKELASRNFSGIPIVDGGKVVGIVTEADLVKRVARQGAPRPISFTMRDGFLFLADPQRSSSELGKILGQPVSTIMSSPVVAVSPEAGLDEIATVMTERKINRVVVVEGSKLVGIVTRANLVKAFAKEADKIPA